MVIIVASPILCQEAFPHWELLQWRDCSGGLNWSFPNSSMSLYSWAKGLRLLLWILPSKADITSFLLENVEHKMSFFIAVLFWVPKVLLMMSNMTSKAFPNFLRKFEACNFQWLLTHQRIERLRALLTEGLEEHRSWGHPAKYRAVLYLSWSRNLKVVSVSQINVLTTGYRATQGASQDYEVYGHFIRQNALWFTIFPYLCTRENRQRREQKTPKPLQPSEKYVY